MGVIVSLVSGWRTASVSVRASQSSLSVVAGIVFPSRASSSRSLAPCDPRFLRLIRLAPDD